MSGARRASRTKSLDVEPLGGSLLWFRLALDDRHFGPEGEERIHSLAIDGVLSLPDLVIRAIRPVSNLQPYAECAASLEPVRRLAGRSIGPGFRQAVIDAMGRTRGCTHFMSLALDLAAAHTLSVFLRMRARVPFDSRHAAGDPWMQGGLEIEPRLENACIALQSSSPVIRRAKEAKGS